MLPMLPTIPVVPDDADVFRRCKPDLWTKVLAWFRDSKAADSLGWTQETWKSLGFHSQLVTGDMAADHVRHALVPA